MSHAVMDGPSLAAEVKTFLMCLLIQTEVSGLTIQPADAKMPTE